MPPAKPAMTRPPAARVSRTASQTAWSARPNIVFLLTAFGFGLAARTVGLPPLVGYLVAGFVLNSFGVAGGDILARISDAGVTLLVVMAMLKLLETRRPRDAFALIFLCYFLVITNFLYRQTPLLAVYMFATAITITENGAAYNVPKTGGSIADPRRRAYLERHLAEMHRAIADGVPVVGYFVWSLLDNFEWACGDDKRFGIVRVDPATKDRTIKDSGWFNSWLMPADIWPIAASLAA